MVKILKVGVLGFNCYNLGSLHQNLGFIITSISTFGFIYAIHEPSNHPPTYLLI
jgi:hypothetical protein